MLFVFYIMFMADEWAMIVQNFLMLKIITLLPHNTCHPELMPVQLIIQYILEFKFEYIKTNNSFVMGAYMKM